MGVAECHLEQCGSEIGPPPSGGLARAHRPSYEPIMSSSERARENAGWTLLTLVVDRSGSMAGIRRDMERGIKALIQEQARAEGTCVVTLTQFDDEYEVVTDGVPAAEMAPYRLDPRGGTALLDAIGRTIAMVRLRIDNMSPQDRPTNVVVAVITDGAENSSREWSRLQVMEAIQARTAEGWLFTFLGPDEDALEAALHLGIDARSLLTWEPSDKGTAGAMKSLSDSSRRLRSGESSRIEYTEAERLAASGRLTAPKSVRVSGRPYLLLDVDGVLAVSEKELGADDEMFDDFALHEVPFEVAAGYRRSVPVWLSRSMAARIVGLTVDVHWVTTWEHRAGSAIAPRCGLPQDLPVLIRGDDGEEWDLDWKFLAVQGLVEQDPRPFVWIDADIDFLDDGSVTPRSWAHNIPVPSLLIAPDTRTGLLPRDLDTVDEFVRRHGDASEVEAGSD